MEGHSVEPAAPAYQPRRTRAGNPPEEGEKPVSQGEIIRTGLATRLPLLETVNGITVIDASKPSSRGSASRGQPRPNHIRAAAHSPCREGVDKRETFDDREASGTMAHAEALTRSRKSSSSGPHFLLDASAETLPASAQSARPFSPGGSARGIPLPQEVLEALRVSISCFPETMLLTSSLSIEMIRAYSKKLRHQTDPGHHLESDGSQSMHSTSSHNARIARRWNLSWLNHGQRSRPQQQQQQYHNSTSSDLSSSLDAASVVSSVDPQTRAPPSWAPIKTIFPTASDYLCDALYAHLLAYNYINTLCPARTGAPRSHINRSHSDSDSRSNSQPDRAPRSAPGLGIPHKAASLLGMDDDRRHPVAAEAAAARQRQRQHQHRQQQQQQRSPGDRLQPQTRHRRLLARRGAGDLPFGDAFPLLSPNSSSSSNISGGGGTGGMEASSSSSSPPSSSEAAAAAMMREVQAGLGRCVALLVATLKRTAAGGAGAAEASGGGVDGEAGLLLACEQAAREADGGVDPVLLRALCEVVRCAEEGS